jgi:hypothetical protein
MNDSISYYRVVDVNAHLHTPYSFSAFSELNEALDRALEEGVKIVGINDFYSTDGYDHWAKGCAQRKLFPLFNIEMIALHEEDRENGIRVNDPNNPGRTYISGKGLRYPSLITGEYASLLSGIRNEANRQVEKMCAKLNELLVEKNAGFTLDFGFIEKEMTKGLVRERHLAKALRSLTYDYFKGNKEAISQFLARLFGGTSLKSDPSNHATVENEIRSNLLKAGGAAFVEENPEAFPPLETIRQLILASGGIPTYPFLGDDAKGNFTDFEKDISKAAKTLKQRGFFSVEFITTRNSIAVLEEYAGYLSENGFVVTFGSEHNTPAMEPIKLSARGGVPLTDKLKRINYEGACIIASHQELVNSGSCGYIDNKGIPVNRSSSNFIEQGHKLISAVIG